MDIKHITDTILPTFEALKTEENIEVEIRLGKHNGSLFDTNVGRDTWERILKGLKNYDGWESTNYTESDVYYNDNSNVRITSNEDTGEQTMIQKISVVKEDFKCEPLDVRVCIAREIPTSGEYEMDRKRTKMRHSFVRKNLSIDMTISSGDNVDMDSEEESSYQIELEIVKPGDVDSVYKLFNIINKVADLVKIM
ncbi:hypothetical protein FK873_gp084 [Micromonas pusilla virus SP1]|jgi:hypothetical protein|uniref:mRNA 5'-phosphatase n=1 Tax=Micromonas pusilla virus SP1 TaxID=373996 RepID=G9E655_MPSP1|nr:hypothetical protein FK873_gp084 [Micromonas pusilla virus SP1]AET84882.1 hypothetical protein MPXG_00084 [Micromonas pusilla virus SP1]